MQLAIVNTSSATTSAVAFQHLEMRAAGVIDRVPVCRAPCDEDGDVVRNRKVPEDPDPIARVLRSAVSVDWRALHALAVNEDDGGTTTQDGAT